MLHAEDVTVSYGPTKILDGVSLTAPPGEVLGLIGPNGAGKSTLLAALAGDVAPTSGRVTVCGREPRMMSVRELARLRAVMLQDVSVAFSFPVHDVVRMGRRAWGKGMDDEDIIAAALAATDTAHLAERDVMTLSGGERARVALSRVLAQQAPVVLFDEPTAAMDVRHQEQSLGLIRQLAACGASVVVVLHDLNAAAAYCDRIVCLADGRVAASGSVAEVYQSEILSEVYRWPISVSAGEDGYIHVAPQRGGGAGVATVLAQRLTPQHSSN